MTSRAVLAIGVAALLTGCRGPGVAGSVDVENISAKRVQGLFVYGAKFLCGTIPALATAPTFPAGDTTLVPGTYLTAVNIHNPDTLTILFEKRAVIANAQVDPRGRVGEIQRDTLTWDQALEVDCADVLRLLQDTTDLLSGFLKGFIVVRSRTELDVVGVYSFKNVEQ